MIILDHLPGHQMELTSPNYPDVYDSRYDLWWEFVRLPSSAPTVIRVKVNKFDVRQNRS